jgi:hypothetical protein
MEEGTKARVTGSTTTGDFYAHLCWYKSLILTSMKLVSPVLLSASCPLDLSWLLNQTLHLYNTRRLSIIGYKEF